MSFDFPRKARMLVAVALCGVTAAASAQTFPPTLSLPAGWQPEGIAAGRGNVLYVGSLASGAIFALDPRTGAGQVLSPGAPGVVSVGLEFDRRTNLLYVAGGATGQSRMIDAESGAVLATFPLASVGFINDAAVTRDAVYFTNSSLPVLYRLPLEPGGRPAPSASVTEIPLSGDWQQVPGFNANGIVATPQGQLLVVNSATGLLYRVDPATGVATQVNLGGALVTAGDGLLLEGHTLYVVRNRLNEVVVIELESDFTSGVVAETITNAAFDVPTTLTRAAGALYTVNARFGTPPTPDTTYDVVRFR
jgi:sugar lactone lactonase YvrE